MIQKPKRPTKINNQDNKQPQKITELIRRYDLDNTKIYDFLDNLVEQLNLKNTENDEKLNKIEYKISETILYENEEGTSEEITLSETSANFYMMTIFYKDINGVYSSVDVYIPDGKSVNLTALRNGSNAMVIYNAIISISNDLLSWNSNKRYSLSTSEYVDESGINIVKIIGYKEA